MHCTDPAVFYRPDQTLAEQRLTRKGTIYVANSRRVRRDMVQWIEETNADVQIYGRGWGWLDLRIRGEHIPNGELGKRTAHRGSP